MHEHGSAARVEVDRKVFGRYHETLRLLVTSRHEGDIEVSIGSLCPQGHVRVGEDFANEDTGIYLDGMLGRHTKLAKRREEIKASLLKNAQGMFGLAALQIEDLIKCRKRKEMQEHLDRPPSTLFAMYDRILSRLDHGGREDARKVLLWLAFSVHKLNLRQLVEVIAVNFDTEDEPCFYPTSRYEDS
ncbi:hypothetical protein HETIRDRAFT_330662 [Heterobasidion irregulare TC 32-1]|uniref:Uncharacterized protein n=1 Tax=Heterobasidion irregulare (strain TC 32-1) TaxID=747525 RepID=W4JNT2_HETIT|nr:uncharacterized protein HETIRDRAFT_330662 [Heterobasidion irregulare TC 32-1]ETW75217.1 hypothetical protein HETIRDRAFT_330662 [Heterobasidion irregulare TC 32-1]